MLRITNNNGDTLGPMDGYKPPREARLSVWDHPHRAWDYTITGEQSGAKFQGTFRAGLGLNFGTSEELREELLECIAHDIATATDYDTARPSIRTILGDLGAIHGEMDPVAAYDIAREIKRLAEWHADLSPAEAEALAEYVED